ncbi:putative transcription cofactor vestigial-like protein 3 [Apostichopus japonicus]|uniref:Putative transcription cofactor vestigial-like protein 3 n=2 Tax=Stichopus japonicus TaxID=307972 RepID=A0A2G8LFX5_STIJA|nr:putative transcription cofactor vestigial-like protein 3 [Apostichopus japonicus]
MQDALLESYPVAGPVDFVGAHTLPLQPYHSPAVSTQNHISGAANTGIHYASTHALTSQEHQFFKLEANRYTQLQPRTNIGSEPVKAGVDETEQNGGVDEVVPEAEYVNARCVIFTFYTGDVNTVVDEHFKKALDQPSSFSRNGVCHGEHTTKTQKGTADDWNRKRIKLLEHSSEASKIVQKDSDNSTSTLMCRRNFPPSFWNSNYWQELRATSLVPIDGTNLHYLNSSNGSCYYQNANNTITPYRTSDSLFAAESYSAYRQRVSGLHNDPWHYTFAAHHQSAFAHHKSSYGIHELSYGYASGSAFNPRYSSLLIQPTVRPTILPAIPGQMELPKPSVTDTWNSQGYNGIHTHPQYYSTDLQAYSIADSNPGVDTHDTMKDFLWF